MSARPLFDATAVLSTAAVDSWVDLTGNPLGGNNQTAFTLCAWHYADPAKDITNTIGFCHAYTFDAGETIKPAIIGTNISGETRYRLGLEVWSMTTGSGFMTAPVSETPLFPCWLFVALVAPAVAGNSAIAYFSTVDSDRWIRVTSATFTAPATKPDQLYVLNGGHPGLRSVAHFRAFNSSLSFDEVRQEKWRFRPSGREWGYFPLGRQRTVNLMNSAIPINIDPIAATFTVPGPSTHRDRLAAARRVPLDYDFARPAIDVSNTGWTRVP